MTTPRDHEPHMDHDLGPDYEAFVSEAARAFEPSAEDAARVRARLDEALGGAAPSPAAAPTAAGVATSLSRGVTVRWLGLALLSLAVLGAVLVTVTSDGEPVASSQETSSSASDTADTDAHEGRGQEGGAALPEAGLTPGQGEQTGGVESEGGTGMELAEPGEAQPASPRAAERPGEQPTAARPRAPTQPPAAPQPASAPAQLTPTEVAATPNASSAVSTETGNPSAPSQARESLLAREAARLLRARNALSAGQPGEALTLTTRLPEGDPLSPERRAIRVRALCALGRTAEARQVAGSLADGNGPSAAAVRASCVGGAPAP